MWMSSALGACVLLVSVSTLLFLLVFVLALAMMAVAVAVWAVGLVVARVDGCADALAWRRAPLVSGSLSARAGCWVVGLLGPVRAVSAHTRGLGPTRW